jgi:DNA-binding transcriptional LysR family regulator
METLSGIESFVRSAENGSFSAAARLLGITPAAVSKNVATLESQLGIRLFQRSTRRLTLTESGERFLIEASTGLSTLQSAITNLASSSGLPSGTLKVSLAPAFGRAYVLPLLGDFLTTYPSILPDWHFDNRQVDLIGEGFDAAIGGGIELSSGVVARELARLHLIAVASPTYLASQGDIQTPERLSTLDGVLWRSPQTGRVRPWLLHYQDGQQITIKLKPRITVNDPESLCHAVLMGLGVGLVAMPHALPHLKSGALVRLLPDWYSDAGAISLYYSSTRLLPAKTRAFVDYIVEAFQSQHLAQQLRGDDEVTS